MEDKLNKKQEFIMENNSIKYTNYQVVFREIPEEITLAINITNCPNRCVGCHSPELQEDIGEILTTNTLFGMIEAHEEITCVLFLGDGGAIEEVISLIKKCKLVFTELKFGIYTGDNRITINNNLIDNVNYLKIGKFNNKLGGLDVSTTNQRLIKITNLKMYGNKS